MKPRWSRLDVACQRSTIWALRWVRSDPWRRSSRPLLRTFAKPFPERSEAGCCCRKARNSCRKHSSQRTRNLPIASLWRRGQSKGGSVHLADRFIGRRAWRWQRAPARYAGAIYAPLVWKEETLGVRLRGQHLYRGLSTKTTCGS
jgi:hypothetical protein